MKALDIDSEGLRMPDGTLRAFTSIGSYPITYYTADGDSVCAKCAHEDCQTEDPADKDTFLVGAGVRWEGEPLACAVCNEDIESAYGPLGENEVEDHVVVE
jgi:hypothetical protein